MRTKILLFMLDLAILSAVHYVAKNEGYDLGREVGKAEQILDDAAKSGHCIVHKGKDAP